MAASLPKAGELFPVGGPVPAALMVGRSADVEDLAHRLRQRVSTILVGPRRIGKTTVCDAACARLVDDFTILERIEVPERADGSDLLREIVRVVGAATPRQRTARSATRIFAAAAPTLQDVLRTQLGVDVDLAALAEADAPRTPAAREILGLPLALARGRDKPVLLYLDEVQRIASYTNGDQLLKDLVDMYSGQANVVVLMDGSDERAIDRLLAPPVDLAKLAHIQTIPPTIDDAEWRPHLRGRFARLRHPLEIQAERVLLEYGQGRPIATMAAAQGTAVTMTNFRDGLPTDHTIARQGVVNARQRLAGLD